VLGPLHQIVEAGYEARGGADPNLPGAAGVTGSFGRADIRIQVDESGELFVLSKSDGMVRYIVEAFGEGDFDFDGDVDGRDFLVWQRNPSVGDLADWQANFAATGSLAGSLGVPEPSSMMLAMLIIGLCGSRSPRVM
jgi:hypothetical protein